ncbi:MAG TPA: assimilatory sulfite reductase (NADPH) flavoprotein subunit [Steroidobacter sp.]
MRSPHPADASVWSSAPFDAALAEQARHFIAHLNAAQRMWLSGYLAGALANVPSVAAEPATATRPIATILYGSHSGNCEQLAKQLHSALASRGLSVELLDMIDCRKNHLQDAQHLFVLVSTHGDGEPPERALPLYELLHSRKAPKLDHVQFSVLALGDSSYEKFCETGRRFDAQLEALGARRLHALTECDVDFQPLAEQWINAMVEKLGHIEVSAKPAASSPARSTASIATAYTRKNPFAAPVLVNQRLTARGSTKDVRHIELSIEGSGIHYEPGDALGVVPRNHSMVVSELLDALPFDPESAVTVGGGSMSLRDALTEHFDIGLLTRSLLERYSAAVKSDALSALLAPERQADLDRFLHGRHLIDLVLEYPPSGLEVAQFTALLRPLAPRLYSIASSPRATPDEVHLTVRLVAYESLGRSRRGVVSSALAELTGETATAAVYPHRNPAFRLPDDPDAPVIMVGPGTGVAPFRAFLADREAVGARGRNWLFFGDRSFRHDFLYQTEWLAWRKKGLLRLDVAFSRDTDRKIYVQHRLQEHGAEIYSWLENGAHLYVCGDAQHMAPDVERTLLGMIEQHGARSRELAAEYLLELQRSRRYQKDVY